MPFFEDHAGLRSYLGKRLAISCPCLRAHQQLLQLLHLLLRGSQLPSLPLQLRLLLLCRGSRSSQLLLPTRLTLLQLLLRCLLLLLRIGLCSCKLLRKLPAAWTAKEAAQHHSTGQAITDCKM